MPFTLIRGTYHLVNRTSRGNETGFKPDGDSIHFKAANPALVEALPVIGRPLSLSNIGSVNLRLEGIDALELHFRPDGGRETRQPRPLADQSRDFLTGLLGFNPVPYVPPSNLAVDPPIQHDGAAGYILSRSLEVNGRPVSFAFAGAPNLPDGATLELTVPLLKASLNYQLLRAGQAYPLFYDGLVFDIRQAMSAAVRSARRYGRGLWPHDRSQNGLVVNAQADLESGGVLFPKLFRRLSEYWAQAPADLSGFPAWLAGTEERVLDMPLVNFTHFDNVVQVQNNTVRLRRQPEELVFISAK